MDGWSTNCIPRGNTAADIPIQLLVRAFPVSTRLYNCVHDATNLPFETVGAYLSAGANAVPVTMAALRNFGRRSAEELDTLVRQVACGALNVPTLPNTALNDQELDRVIADDQVAALLTLSLEEAAHALGAPKGAQEALATLRALGGFLPYRSLLEFYADGDHAVRNLSMLGGVAARELYGTLTQVRPNTPFFVALVNEIQKEGRVYGRAAATFTTPIELVNQLVATLDPNLQAILRFRYGYGGEVDHTLGEIGDKLGITRERVRQLEVKALAKLSPYTDYLCDALTADKDHIWSYLKASYGVVPKRRFDLKYFIEYVLPGEIELAFDVVFEGDISRFFVFLDCRETPTAWYRTSYNEVELESATEQLKQYLGNRPLPLPVSTAARDLGLARDLIGLVATISDRTNTHEGYILASDPTRRMRRALRLHRLLATLGSNQIIPIQELIAAFNSRYPDLPTSGRDAAIVMVQLPHLFCAMADFGWRMLGEADALEEDTDSPPSIRLSPVVSDADDTDATDDVDAAALSGTRILRELLQDGPLSLGELTALFLRRSDGRYARASVAPLLLTMTDVRRGAPGIYVLSDYLSSFDPQRGEVPSLLEPASCRLYVLARHAGERRGAFPFWTVGMERAWCRWAEARERAEGTLEMRILYESLLSVVAPGDWGTTDQDYWYRQKELRGRFALETPPARLQDAAPDPTELLRNLLYLDAYGELNWLAANRLANRVVHSSASVTTLATLIGLGALAPARHWQVAHERGETCAYWAERLQAAQTLSVRPLDWQDSVCQELLNTLTEKLQTNNLGWVDVSQLREVVARNLTWENVEEAVEEWAEDDQDAMLLSFREERRTERMNRLLAEVQADLDDDQA